MESGSAGKEDLPWGWDVGLGKFPAFTTPRSAIPAIVELLLCHLIVIKLVVETLQLVTSVA